MIFLYLFIFITIFHFISFIPLACICLLISWTFMLYLFYRISWNYSENQKQLPLVYSISDAYHQFKSGDIVFLREYDVPMRMTDILTMHYNYGFAHTVYIHEKNNILYVLHATPNSMEDKHLILYTYTYMNSNWNVVDEPLTEFLIKYKCMYEIHRPPKPISLSFDSVISKTDRFCTQLVANLLRHHNIIQSKGGIYFNDVPDQFIKNIYDKGYRSFRFKHI